MKVMIVEDEPRVRKGLSESVSWEELGMELVGAAANGLEGLELFDREQPELVIADIRMPVMDGLAMSEAMLERKPGTKIIMISGHDEFEYAKRCVSLGVTNYVLKPIGREALREELLRVRRDWERERQEREQTRRLEEKWYSYLPVLRNAFLEDWLTSRTALAVEALRDKCSFFDIPMNPALTAMAAIFELDCEAQDELSAARRAKLQFAMNQMIEEAIAGSGVCYQRGNGQTAAVYQADAPNVAEQGLQWAERVRERIAQRLGMGVTASVGSRAAELTSLPAVFQEAERVLRLKQSVGTNMILFAEMVRPAAQEQFAVMTEADEAMLVHGVEMNDETEIAAVVEGLFRRWHTTGALAYPEEVSFQFIGVYAALAHRLGRGVRSFLDQEQLELWRRPEQFSSMEEMKRWWIRRFTELSRGYGGFRTDRKTKIIREVKQYVDDHIFDNMTRDDAARHVYMNSSYISRLFREVTGEAFSDYVLRRKMETAMALLQDERMMVYEVADRLGYKDPSYFARVFKKFTGKNPTEFQ